MGQKLGSNRCPLFTMLTKQKFFNVLRSKLVKKTKGLPGLLSDPLSQGFRFSKESGLIILGDLPILKKSGPFSRVTCPHTLIMVYFQGRSAHTYSRWSIFTGDLPTHTHTGLFSRATCPHIRWSIFTGDLPTHTHTGLLSRATCPHTLSLWSIFTGELPTHTHCGLFSGATCPHTHTGLFSRATCPHKLTLVYFHGRPALLIGLTWDPIWRSPLTRTKIGV
jgi:hypothetical protein